jgi:cytidylate kinase
MTLAMLAVWIIGIEKDLEYWMNAVMSPRLRRFLVT